MSKPLVSVLMTVYNREKYIAEAIQSVMDSTYQNWELIIVDDRSKDRSVEIAQEFEKKDSRIRIYVNEVNLGDYPNRNKAASYAQGKYLKYVDADDLIYPYGLEQLVFYMEQFPEAGYGLCSIPPDRNKKFPFDLTTTEAYERHYFSTPIFNRAPLSAIINRTKFEEVGGFSGKRMLGDFEMWHILSQRYSVVLMPQGIAWYRVHEEQEMSLHRSDPIEPLKYKLCAQDLLNSPHCPLSVEKRMLALKIVNNEIVDFILSALKHHSLKKFLQMKSLSNTSFTKIVNRFMTLVLNRVTKIF